jgi:aromatic-L-amino-acid decarboxylase
VNGVTACRSAVERGLEFARQTAELVKEAPHLELICELELSVVLFRRPGWVAEQYRSWSREL